MKRHLYLTGGLAALGLGIVGVLLPIMPTVPFLLLAAFCFSQSHPKWADRLYDHPHYGESLRNWRDRRAISRRAKISAVIAMAIGVGFTWWTVGWPWVLVSVAALAIAGTWICTRNEPA